MPNLLQTERTKYEDAWALPAYSAHAPGEMHLPLFLDMAQPAKRATVLDAGCGSGKGALALKHAGFDVTMCDVTPAGLHAEARSLRFVEACLWQDLSHVASGVGHPGRQTFDWVYCTDVLEHVPTALTMLVVARLLGVARYGVFLSISMIPDTFGVWIGTPLHESIMPFTWWRDHLGAVGQIVEARDLLNAGVFLVRPT
jgi:2-polyprenyl-3-methyl-5-hydroxy-6-metoxy-1,4-benzoquinol methylase